MSNYEDAAMAQVLAVAKALADESRLRILAMLEDGELCLCQIVDVLGLAPSTVSRHVNLLRGAGLVEMRKLGTWHYFRLARDDAPETVRRVLGWVQEELRFDTRISSDARKIARIRRQDPSALTSCYVRTGGGNSVSPEPETSQEEPFHQAASGSERAARRTHGNENE